MMEFVGQAVLSQIEYRPLGDSILSSACSRHSRAGFSHTAAARLEFGIAVVFPVAGVMLTETDLQRRT
jgi:hypothetical protein